MRTTVDLPDDLHRVAVAIARDQHTSLSRTIADLVRRGLQSADDVQPPPSRTRNGFPLLYTSRPLTSEDVRGLDDDE